MNLLPEWHQQEAVILAWPHDETDWQLWMDDARKTYTCIIHSLHNSGVVTILLCRKADLKIIESCLPQHLNVLLIIANYDDTWVRDYAFLTCESEQGNAPIEFTFNGWGKKFNADNDNRINKEILAPLCRLPLISHELVLEGGAVEIDANRHLISTVSCLSNPLRNAQVSDDQYKHLFKTHLGAEKVTLFNHGHLEGDDTDGHIDTLVRFTPSNGLVIQSAFNRPADPIANDLVKLKQECIEHFPNHRLFELPLPFIQNKKNQRLPASYANFLICNQSILVPTYSISEDQKALDIISQAFPKHLIIDIDCSVLIEQYGSLHCVTMHVPIDTLKPEVMRQAKTGLTVLSGSQR